LSVTIDQRKGRKKTKFSIELVVAAEVQQAAMAVEAESRSKTFLRSKGTKRKA
jgi:hypothetical protein